MYFLATNSHLVLHALCNHTGKVRLTKARKGGVGCKTSPHLLLQLQNGPTSLFYRWICKH